MRERQSYIEKDYLSFLLSLDQVNDVINGKEVIVPLKDILEVKNAIRAYEELEIVNSYSKKNC